MVSHQRLQHYRANYCSLCMTGLLGCRWHRYKQSTRDSRKRDLISFTVLVVTFLYLLFFFYFWLVAGNDYDDFNWYLYIMLSKWFPWYKVFLGLTCTIFIYYTVLMCLTLLHVLHGHQMYIFPLHLVISIITLACCVTTTVILDNLWRSEWSVVKLSLQITGPFLHIGIVAFMTLLTWVIAGQWLQLSYKASSPVHRWTVLKMFWLTLYIGFMAVLYLCPLLINSPCVITGGELPSKPQVIGHRGAPAVAPENTMYSFQSAVRCNAMAFESDVRISYDGIPFLLHDKTLKRTTNNSMYEGADASWYNISQLKRFDAGSWYLSTDPFNTVSSLTDEERHTVRQQTIPTLMEMLQLAKNAKKRVIFDVFYPPGDHPYYNTTEEIIINTIHRSGIDQKQIFWYRDHKLPPGGENFTLTAIGYETPAVLKQNNFSAVNYQYDMITAEEIRELNEDNITTNVYTINSGWMFSLYWCIGATSVSSDMCQMIADIDRPVWHMSPQNYLIMWISVDVLSVVVVVIFFIIQRVRLYGTKFNPETLSLQSGRADNSYEEMYKSKNMKQRLLRKIDPFEIGLDQTNGSLNSSELPVGSYCLHTLNGSGRTTSMVDSAPVSDVPVIGHTEMNGDLS